MGVDLVVDAAGVSDSLLIAMDLVRPNGQQQSWLGTIRSYRSYVQKYLPSRKLSHNWPIWERVIQLSNGSLDVKHIIGGIWSINDWEKAFREMYSGKIVKSILKLYEIKDKVIIITGSTMGIGKAIAKRAVAEGAKLFFMD